MIQQMNVPGEMVSDRALELDGCLSQIDTAALARRCATESDRFFRGQVSDQRFSYELFRRALVDCDQAAWVYLYQHYTPLVEGWVRRTTAFAGSGESSDYFVSAAFTKFWRAITPARFASFPSLAALLHYLQLCTTSVVIDSVRSRAWSEMLPEEAAATRATARTSPDEEAIQRVNGAEFWQFINAQLQSEQERVAIHASFVLGMTPRAIAAQWPDLFATVHDVYSTKRNVLARLGRNQQLRQLADEEE